MKYLLLLSILFPALVFAQTPSLYDEWSPSIAGTIVHITITQNEIIASNSGKGNSIATYLTAQAPMPSSDAPKVETKSDIIAPKVEKAKLLKVVYDSAQAKGRLFVQSEKESTPIIALSFLIKDNGQMQIGLASNIMDMISDLDCMPSKTKKQKTLKQVERATSKPSLNNLFSDFSISFYNKTRCDEFAKLKDPIGMPKAELIGMIGSFGDRMAAALQALPQDSISAKSFLSYFSFMVPVVKHAQHIATDLFIAHGYNPIAIVPLMEKYEHDSDVELAGKNMGSKIEESIPLLREEKIKRKQRLSDIAYIAERNRVFEKAEKDEREYADSNMYPQTNVVAEPAPVSVDMNGPEVDAERNTEEAKPITPVETYVTYPETARKKGLSGKVLFSALIQKDGNVEKVIIDKSDNPIFNESVIEAVKKTRFSPAKQGSVPVKVWYTQTINFKLTSPEVKPAEK
jgi:TonB family protein